MIGRQRQSCIVDGRKTRSASSITEQAMRFYGIVVAVCWFLGALLSNTIEISNSATLLFTSQSSSLAMVKIQLFSFALGIIPVGYYVLANLRSYNGLLTIALIWFLYALLTSRSMGDLNLILVCSLPLVITFMGERAQRLLTSTISYIIIIYIIISVVCYLGRVEQFVTPGYGVRASGAFHSPNTLYIFAITAFYWLFGTQHSQRQAWARYGWNAAFASLIGLILLSGNRAGILGFCTSLLLIPSVRRCCRGVLLPVVIVLGIVIIGARTTSSFSSIIPDKAMTGRTSVWRSGIAEFLKCPVFGHGVSGFEHSEFYLSGLADDKAVPSEPKNLYIALLVAFGVVGLCILGWYYRELMAASIHEPGQMSIALFACLAAIGIAGLFDTPVIIGVKRLPGSFLLFCLIGSYMRDLYSRRFGASVS